MIDDDLYYILLDEVQLAPRFEALPKISENTQIFLVEILKNTQIFYNIVVVLPTFWCLIREKVVTFRMVKLNMLLSIFLITK